MQDNHDLDLKPRMTANVSIITARKERALGVPNAALRVRMPGGESDVKTTQVWMLDGSGRPHSVPIKTGIVDAVFTEVREGNVREGDSIIVGMDSNNPAAAKPLPPGFGPRNTPLNAEATNVRVVHDDPPSFTNAQAKPMRAALTMLGIIIGVGAVVAMVSLGQGAAASVQAQITSLATNLLIIIPGAMTVSGVRTG